MDITKLGLLTDEEAAELRGLHEELSLFVQRMEAGYLRDRMATLVERAKALGGKATGVGEMIEKMEAAQRGAKVETVRAANLAKEITPDEPRPSTQHERSDSAERERRREALELEAVTGGSDGG